MGVVHREAAADYVSSLGADLVSPLSDGWAERVREYTCGRGVDIVVDPIGGPAFDDAIRVLAIDGKLLVIGFAASSIPTVKVNRLLLRDVSVVGVAWGECLRFVSRSCQSGRTQPACAQPAHAKRALCSWRPVGRRRR
jgi:NADPH:quinone reductase